MAKFLIHNVTRGPFDDGEDYWNVCLAETSEGEMVEFELYFEDMASAIQMKEHFGRSIDPIELEIEEEDDE